MSDHDVLYWRGQLTIKINAAQVAEARYGSTGDIGPAVNGHSQGTANSPVNAKSMNIGKIVLTEAGDFCAARGSCPRRSGEKFGANPL